MGAILLNKELGENVVSPQKLVELCQVTMESGRQLRSQLNLSSDVPVMYAYHGTLYLGSLHVVICFVVEINVLRISSRHLKIVFISP